jgi:hypothetical protein
MKKLILILGIPLALLLVGAFVAAFFLGSIVTKGVNTFGPKITGTKVTLERAKISPLSGSGTLDNLFVGNPPGWKSDKAFSFSRIHVSVTPYTLLGDHIVIKEIHIDGPEFVYEARILNSNIKDLMRNIEKNTGGADKKPAEEVPTKEGKPLKFAIKSFRLENARVTLGVGPTAITLPMPPLVITDLGVKERGITPDQLVAKVMTAIVANIGKTAADAALKAGGAAGSAATDAAADTAKKATDGLKKIFNDKKE